MMTWLLGPSRYVSELACLTNDSVMASLYVIADVILGTSLLAIAIRLWKFRADGYWLYPHQVKMGFGLAVLFGLGYFVDVLVLYEGAYRLEVVLRSASAGVAVVLAFSFWMGRR